MSLRQEFVQLASLDGANIRKLCRQFDISPTSGYKWLKRHQEQGLSGLTDQSRQPRQSPKRTPEAIEHAVVTLRQEHPTWGARKLRRRLQDQNLMHVPAMSTITAILKRHGLIDPPLRPQRDLQRFERPHPNDLWQIDFKGHFNTDEGPCHPLTSIDDCSRYCLNIFACANEDELTVRPLLEQLFRTYGLPNAILCDNGSPWGNSCDRCPVTSMGIWLWRLGIDILHGRPSHPQTQGKLERFHRTLKADVIARPHWKTYEQCQIEFDRWRPIYNVERPHEALEDETPASRYHVSSRPFPTKLPAIEYDEGVTVRRVSNGGALSYRNQFYYVGRAFKGYAIGLIQTATESIYEVRFGWKTLGHINIEEKAPSKTQTVSVWTSKKETTAT